MQVGNRVRIRQDGGDEGKEAQPQARTRPLCFVYLLMAFNMWMVTREPLSAYGLPLARRKRMITQPVFKTLGALADGSGPGPLPGGTSG